MKINEVKQIGIIGTGIIANGTAVLTTLYGYSTTMLALTNDLAKESQSRYDEVMDDFVARGVLSQERAEYCRGLLRYTIDYSDLANVDVIFEAVVEIPEVKRSVYSLIEENCSDIKVICSMSSALEVDVLTQDATKYKDRIIVAHPFSPVYMVPYFELAKGTETDDKVLRFAKRLLETMDRKPVVLKKSIPGFIGNRLQFALWREAMNIVESGVADPEDVDTCLQYSFCPRYTSIGIFEHFDNCDLELCRKVSDFTFPTLANTKEAPELLTNLLDAGKRGRPTGEGFYDWSNVNLKEFQERLLAPYWKFAKFMEIDK